MQVFVSVQHEVPPHASKNVGKRRMIVETADPIFRVLARGWVMNQDQAELVGETRVAKNLLQTGELRRTQLAIGHEPGRWHARGQRHDSQIPANPHHGPAVTTRPAPIGIGSAVGIEGRLEEALAAFDVAVVVSRNARDVRWPEQDPVEAIARKAKLRRQRQVGQIPRARDVSDRLLVEIVHQRVKDLGLVIAPAVQEQVDAADRTLVDKIPRASAFERQEMNVGQVRDSHRFPYSMTMFFRQLFDPESSTYTYVLGDPVSREAVVIDPVRERKADVLATLRDGGLSLRISLETHVHADHITGGGELRSETGARLGMHALANDCHCADLSLHGGDEVEVGGLRIRVLETPGHTPDSVSYLVDKSVFTGDALLVGTCGRTDFQGGDAGALFDSIHEVLFALPDDVVVYPGHDYQGNKSTTIGAEKRHNARAVGRTRAEFIALMNGLHLPPPKKIGLAVPANRHCGLDGTPHSA